jgi:hypothetical protein
VFYVYYNGKEFVIPTQGEESVMLDSESEEIVVPAKVVVQPDAEELVKRELMEHPEILERVEERKKRKFTRSGLLVMIFGAILMIFGILLHSSAYSIGGFIVGVGVIVVIVGFLRILIGLIKPIVPSQL